MIKKFSCNNFRNLNFNDLDFGHKINVLIGSNNSGKSNFIKAISFLANMLISGDSNAFESAFLYECSQNGWGRQINRSLENPNRVDFKWTVELEDELDYSLSFVGGNSNEDFYIVKEAMDSSQVARGTTVPFNFFECHSVKSGKGFFSTRVERGTGAGNRRIEIEMSNRDTVLLQFKDKLLEERDLYGAEDVTGKIKPMIDKIAAYFKKFCSYSSTQFDLNRLRQPSDIKTPSLRLAHDAHNFLNVLNAVCYKYPYSENNFKDKLKELIHGLDLSRISPEYDKLTMQLGHNKKAFDLSEVSDGTLKALVLNLVINMPINNVSMLAIDEPELNLHPAWQKVVARWILTSNTINQCFISTHSPDFLDVFTEEFVADRIGLYVFSEEGKIEKKCYRDIKDELDGWELGDLYRAGEPRLGGWPW